MPRHAPLPCFCLSGVERGSKEAVAEHNDSCPKHAHACCADAGCSNVIWHITLSEHVLSSPDSA